MENENKIDNHGNMQFVKVTVSRLWIECFHLTSWQPYWCPETMKRRPCWCTKPILWELNSFLMYTLSFVPINLNGCWPREWKRFVWKMKVSYHISGKQGWRSGESARLPPMWPEFDSGPVPYEGWVCCWFSPCSDGFSLGLRFSSPTKKTTSPNSNSTRTEDLHENQLRLMWLSLKIFVFSMVCCHVARNERICNPIPPPRRQDNEVAFYRVAVQCKWTLCFSSGVVTVASRPSILPVWFNYNLLHQTRADRETGLNLAYVFAEHQARVRLERSGWTGRGRGGGRDWEKEKENQRVRTLKIHWHKYRQVGRDFFLLPTTKLYGFLTKYELKIAEY